MAERIHIPAREGRGVRVGAGTRFRVVDIEGGQVGDLFAFCADDITEYASAEHTRVSTSRLFPRVGEYFVTNRRRPILHFEEDATPGLHDMLCAACDPSRYAGLGVTGWHASCQENLRRAMATLGHEHVEVPQPINLFMNIPIITHGTAQTEATIGWEPALTNPGDFVTMRAQTDCYVVVSACPQDIVAINNRRPTALAIDIGDW
jgi:uncharacterized protein YcgI (DUF1989 family)